LLVWVREGLVQSSSPVGEPVVGSHNQITAIVTKTNTNAQKLGILELDASCVVQMRHAPAVYEY
jgi:hypothetical protein